MIQHDEKVSGLDITVRTPDPVGKHDTGAAVTGRLKMTPERRKNEPLWDYIARAMTDKVFRKEVPCHDRRLRMVTEEARKKR